MLAKDVEVFLSRNFSVAIRIEGLEGQAIARQSRVDIFLRTERSVSVGVRRVEEMPRCADGICNAAITRLSRRRSDQDDEDQ